MESGKSQAAKLAEVDQLKAAADEHLAKFIAMYFGNVPAGIASSYIWVDLVNMFRSSVNQRPEAITCIVELYASALMQLAEQKKGCTWPVSTPLDAPPATPDPAP